MRHVGIVFIALALWTVSAADVCAQRVLSLAEAQSEARVAAPEVGELQARISAADAIAVQAGRRFRDDPTVSGSLFRGELLGHPDENAWSVSFRQPLDFSGSSRPRLASANADVSRAQFDRDAGLRLLDERVAVAVADLALAQRQVARALQLTNLARIAADAAHQQFDAGTAPHIDADSADLDLAGTLLTLEQTNGDLARSRTRLARLLGRLTPDALAVDDPQESEDVGPAAPDVAPLVVRDPRVRAAMAEIDAARFERDTFARLTRGPLTLGLDYGRERRDIPAGSFGGAPFASGLTASWADSDLVFNVTVPLPWFNRQLEPRARATGRLLAAEAALQRVRADVSAEIHVAWDTLVAAARAVQTVAATPAILNRDAGFIEQAVRAGQFDATTRVIALRRLEDAGRRLDVAVRDLRAARAAWMRVAGAP